VTAPIFAQHQEYAVGKDLIQISKLGLPSRAGARRDIDPAQSLPGSVVSPTTDLVPQSISSYSAPMTSILDLQLWHQRVERALLHQMQLVWPKQSHRSWRSGTGSQRYDPWMGIEAEKLDRQVVRNEMEQARETFHRLLGSATVAELSWPSNGTKWTNGQLLFHMLFGYLIVVRLLVLVRIFGRLPDRFSRVFASGLEASTRPFHVINYVGSVLGPRLLGYAGLGRRFDRVVAKLLLRLDRESDSELVRGMHYPTSWDPYFKAYMTLADIYRYPTQHFEHHRRQLTLRAQD
jgi:hypothetical protein